MLKGLGNLASLLKNAGQMQAKMQEMQEQLAKVHVQGEALGGAVTVEVNGHQKVTAIRIADSLLVDPDRELLEDLLATAANQALEKAKEAAAKQMASLAGMPGMEQMLSQFTGGGSSRPDRSPDTDE